VLVSLLALGGCPAGDQIDRPDSNHGAHVDPAPDDPMSGASGQGGGQAGTAAMMTGGGGSTVTGSGGMQTMVMSTSTGTGGSGSGGMPATGSGGEGAMQAPMFDAGTDPARNQVTAGHVCARLAQIQCAGEAFCCDNPGRDRAACEAAQLAICTQELYLDAITMNAVSGFDPTAATTAFEGFEQRASQCDPTIASYAASIEGLLGMMKGTVADKGNCSPGLVLDEPTAAAYLASCKDIATTACLPKDAVVWNCAARGGEGASCFTDVNCTDGLYCPNPNAEFGTKKCAARKAVGTPCTTANECETLYCKGGSCVEATKHAAYCLGEK
jgi:hypothetical protein